MGLSLIAIFLLSHFPHGSDQFTMALGFVIIIGNQYGVQYARYPKTNGEYNV
jgi:hypothetical protein